MTEPTKVELKPLPVIKEKDCVTTEQVKKPEDKTEEKTTDKWLEEPKVIWYIGDCLESQGFVGDTKNKINSYLNLTTKDYKQRERISAIANAESGAGKSTICIEIAKRYFEKYVFEFTRVTKTALDHCKAMLPEGKFDGIILIIRQMEGAEDAQYQLQMITDDTSGGGLKILISKQATGGDWTVDDVFIPGIPVTVVTTVNIKIDPQTVRRFETIAPDDSSGQTHKIKFHKANIRANPDYETQITRKCDFLLELPNLLKDESSKLWVVIPYAHTVADEIPDVLLARSDTDKVFNKITACAHLFYKQRLTYKDSQGKMRIVASPADWYYAWQLFGDTLSRRLSGIIDERGFTYLRIIQGLCMKSKDGWVHFQEIMDAVHKEGKACQRNTLHQAIYELEDGGYIRKDVDPDNKAKRIYNITSKTYVPFGISFPNELVENSYLDFVKDKLGEELDTDKWNLLRQSMRVFDLETGNELTNIVTERARKMLKL